MVETINTETINC